MDFTGIVVYLVCVNLIAFAAFGVDKSRAQRGAWRISESALLFLAAVGGSIGALAGMHLFHHKTKHWYFVVGFWTLTVLQLGLLGYLEKKGFVVRIPNPDDARGKLVSLTEKADAMEKELKAVGETLESNLTSRLTKQERAQLIRLLKKLLGLNQS